MEISTKLLQTFFPLSESYFNSIPILLQIFHSDYYLLNKILFNNPV